jgi:mobilome CxxCx(11)CxxC protein
VAATTASKQICADCWDRGLNAFATGAIFLRRSRNYRKLLQLLGFVGMIVPLLVGGFVMAFGTSPTYLPRLLLIAGALGLIQLGFSGLSIAYAWADRLEYSLASAADNLDLSVLYRELGNTASNPPVDLDVRYSGLKGRDTARRQADSTKDVTPMELRYGHRAGLRQFQRACASCKVVPVSMTPTNCEVCGKFRRWWK